MPYCISEVRHRAFPDANAVSAALSSLGLSLDELVGAFRGYICPLSPTAGRDFQHDLVEDLKGFLEKSLGHDGLHPARNRSDLTYSRSLSEHADFGLVHEKSNRRVYFQLEFKPNYERDLVRFQIGANEGTLAAAVMVLSIDPRTIDPAYASLPSYETALKTIEALKPSYPLIAVGLRGAHAA
jgi:hypothetical protein